MKKPLRVFLLLAVFSVVSAPTYAVSILFDFSSPGGLSAAINEGWKYVGQTFTAPMTGELDWVSLDIYSGRDEFLQVDLFTAEAGLPTSYLLGRTILDHSAAPLSEMITFSETINVIHGNEYAIVVNYPNAPPAGAGNVVGSWAGATHNPYVDGNLVYRRDINGSFSRISDYDLHFRAFFNSQVPEPASIALMGLGLVGLGFARRKKPA